MGTSLSSSWPPRRAGCSAGAARRVHAAEERHARPAADALLRQAPAVPVHVARAHAEVVLDLLYGLAAVRMCHEHALVGGISAPAVAAGDVPGVADHELEVVVVVDGRADAAVVLDELVEGDDPILISAVKADQELGQHLCLRLSAAENVRMLRSVVDAADVIDGDLAVAGPVEHLEGPAHQPGPSRVHLASQSGQKLVEGDAPVPVSVEEREDGVDVAVLQVNAHVLQPVAHLRLAQTAVAVVVHDAQYASDAADTVRAAAVQQPLADSLEDIGAGARLRGDAACVSACHGSRRHRSAAASAAPQAALRGTCRVAAQGQGSAIAELGARR